MLLLLLLVWLYRPIYLRGQTFGRLRPDFRVIRSLYSFNLSLRSTNTSFACVGFMVRKNLGSRVNKPERHQLVGGCCWPLTTILLKMLLYCPKRSIRSMTTIR